MPFLPDTSTTGARNYPAGWAPISLTLEGSRYIVPGSFEVVMGLLDNPFFPNAKVEINTSLFPQEREVVLPMEISVKPKGPVTPPAYNPYSLTLSINPTTGLFTGTINMTDYLPNFVNITRTNCKIEALVVRIIGASPEQQALGFLTLPAMPDFTVSPVPPASSTPILSAPFRVIATE